MRSSFFWDVTLGKCLPTFQDNKSVPPSGVKQSQENFSATTGPLIVGPTYQRSPSKKIEKPQLHRRKSWKYRSYKSNRPVPVAARSKVWVDSRAPAEIVGSNPTGGMDVCLL